MMRIKFWVITVAAGLSVLLTASLGQWQLSRAATKIEWQERLQVRQAMPEMGWADLSLAHNPESIEALHFRSVEIQGQWMHEATVFLDNRAMGGQAGFFVVTPLLNPQSQQAVLVQRGWVPRHVHDRTLLPDIPQTQGVVSVWGVFAPPPSKLYELGSDGQGPIRQNIDIQATTDQWSLPLLHASVQQTRAQPDEPGLKRDWIVVASDVHKHYGYALQWFSLSALIFLLYVWFQIIAPWRRSRTD
jgi:surfeit locus 1 family protein